MGAAKVMPVVVLVPAFGLRALPWGARLGLAVTLGFSVAPALSQPSNLPLGLAVTLQALAGLPVALSAAVLLWCASMAGGLIDELRHAREVASMHITSDPTGPTGVLFALVAALAFLQSGGPVRVVQALNRVSVSLNDTLERVIRDMLGGVHVAIAIAMPFLVAIVLFELAAAFIARAVTPSNLQSIWPLLRTLFILLGLAIVLERVLSAIALFAAHPL